MNKILTETRGYVILFWVTMVLTLFTRLRLLDFPLERDEGEYAYFGQLLLQGTAPYLEAYNMKFPGTYAMYALIMGVFGESVAGIHLGLLIVNLAAIGLLFIIAKRLFSTPAALTAAAAYALLSLSPTVRGSAAHATYFVVLFMLAGFALLLQARHAKSFRWYSGAGVCFGLAVLMKQQAVFFALFAVLFWLLHAYRPPGEQRGSYAGWGLLAGMAMPLLVTGVLLYAAEALIPFFFWTVFYALEYSSQNTWATGLAHLYQTGRFLWLAGGLMPLWLAAGAGLIILATGRPAKTALLLLIFTACAFLTVTPGLHFRPHYFVTLLPAVALLAGAFTESQCSARSRSFIFTPAAVPPPVISTPTA